MKWVINIFIIGMIIGILLGTIIGIIIMALMISSSDKDKEITSFNTAYMTEISKELIPETDKKKDTSI